jgi:hypothetical protein
LHCAAWGKNYYNNKCNKKIKPIYQFSFAVSILVFLYATVLFGFNAKDFKRTGNTMVTPKQKKGSRLAVSGILLMFISGVAFLLTLILFFCAKHSARVK